MRESKRKPSDDIIVPYKCFRTLQKHNSSLSSSADKIVYQKFIFIVFDFEITHLLHFALLKINPEYFKIITQSVPCNLSSPTQEGQK
jgi:hypothetical protein